MTRTLTLAAALALTATIAVAETVDAGAIRVIDGDTVALGRERIRLLGIDTPETTRARCPSERLAGLIASEALRNLLAGPVSITRNGQDRYGRTLAHLSAGGRDIGAELVAGGFALTWHSGQAAYAARRTHWCGP